MPDLVRFVRTLSEAPRPRPTGPRFASGEPHGLDLAIELAHDIRSPLGSLVTLAEAWQLGALGPVTSTQRAQLQLMLRAARGVAQLVSDVVDTGRPGALDIRDAPEPFRVAHVLRTVTDLVRPMADDAGLHLLVRNRAPSQWVGARTAVTRVLLNLVTNSIQHTERGAVEFGARQRAGRLEFFVNDTGGGLAPPTLAPDPPSQTRDRWSSNGTGLGLAICRRLLHAMGSTLEIESLPGQGTRCRFVLTGPDAT